MKLFPGNQSEKPVSRKVIDDLKKRNSVSGRTIQIADKGLNCAENIFHTLKDGDVLYRIKECVDEFEYKFKDSETGKIKKFKITEKSFCRGQALKPMEKEKYIYLQS